MVKTKPFAPADYLDSPQVIAHYLLETLKSRDIKLIRRAVSTIMCAARRMIELKLYKRRIVCVVGYFDEEREVPCNYVLRTRDGRFKAIATHLVDHLADNLQRDRGEVLERSVGIFDDETAAVKALHAYLRQIELADGERRQQHPEMDWGPPAGKRWN
jgi:hypothetical protein